VLVQDSRTSKCATVPCVQVQVTLGMAQPIPTSYGIGDNNPATPTSAVSSNVKRKRARDGQFLSRLSNAPAFTATDASGKIHLLLSLQWVSGNRDEGERSVAVFQETSRQYFNSEPKQRVTQPLLPHYSRSAQNQYLAVNSGRLGSLNFNVIVVCFKCMRPSQTDTRSKQLLHGNLARERQQTWKNGR